MARRGNRPSVAFQGSDSGWKKGVWEIEERLSFKWKTDEPGREAFKAGVSNKWPARGSNAARERQDK